MAKITTPVKGFTGTIAGVHFADGAGETEDPAALFYFERRGYGIEVEDAPETPEQEAERLAAEAKAAEDAAEAQKAEAAAEAAKQAAKK
jgi:hypothetical protein